MRMVDEDVILQRMPTMITFDQREVFVLLFEAMLGVHREDHVTIDDAVADITARLEPCMVESLRRQAEMMLDYFVAAVDGSDEEPVQ